MMDPGLGIQKLRNDYKLGFKLIILENIAEKSESIHEELLN